MNFFDTIGSRTRNFRLHFGDDLVSYLDTGFLTFQFVAIPLELNEISTKMQEFVITKWQSPWRSDNKFKFYSKIEPDVSLRIKHENPARAKETIIRLRFRT